jgi:hypothetical protein
MERTTILIPGDLRRRLADESHRRRVPQSALIREALERYLTERPAERPHLVGVADVDGVDAREVKAWVRKEWARKAREA